MVPGPRWLLKTPFGTGATQHSRRSGTVSEQPAGWSKRTSSAVAASDLPAALRVEALQRVNAKPLRRRLGRRKLLCSVRRAFKRRKNKAGGLSFDKSPDGFQHPARWLRRNTLDCVGKGWNQGENWSVPVAYNSRIPLCEGIVGTREKGFWTAVINSPRCWMKDS